jgi:Xaa-Pro dipeptidase
MATKPPLRQDVAINAASPGIRIMLEDIDLHFPSHLRELCRRTEEALRAGGFDTLVVYSGRPRYAFQDDRPYPFAVNPHFKHWAPLTDAPDCFVAWTPGDARPRLVFHQPADYWHRPPELPGGAWQDAFEIAIVREPSAAQPLLELQSRRCAFIGEWQPEFDPWGFAAINPPAVLAHLHYARAWKTPYEVECLRIASRLGVRGHLAAAEAFAARASEYEIHLAYLAATGHREEQLPYPNIIALNEGAGILHYTDLRRARPAEHRSLLVDAGAQFRGYACDITRTHAAGSGRFAELVAGVDALQRELCAEVRAGVDYAAIHLAAHAKIGRLLVAHGLVRCSAEAAVERRLTSVFFPHGIGHLLGLQVHDVGGFMAAERGGEIARPAGHPYLRLTRRLEPGTVVTIEPGVYFVDLLLDEARRDGRGADVAWDTVAELKPCGGVRVEDDVACTAGEPENLTRDAFASLSS